MLRRTSIVTTSLIYVLAFVVIPILQARPAQALSAKVVLIGDSIANSAQTSISAKLADDFNVTINAVPGRALYAPDSSKQDGFSALPELTDAIKDASAVVVELGANPVEASSDEFKKKISEYITEIRKTGTGAAIFWVNIGSNADRKDVNGAPNELLSESVGLKTYSERNAAIRDQKGPNNYQVINWFNQVFPAPDEDTPAPDPANIPADLVDVNNYLSDDDKLHLTAGGIEAFSDTIVNALKGTPIVPASANSPEGCVISVGTEKYYRKSEILFNDATSDSGDCQTSCQASPLAAATGGSVPELPPAIIEGAKSNQATYEEVAAEANVPWQMLATIHHHETRFEAGSNPSNGQGVYQFVNHAPGEFPPGPITPEEFKKQTLKAANFLQAKTESGATGELSHLAGPLKATGNDPDKIKNTFFSYNGRAPAYLEQAASLGKNPATQPWEGSPYVMNRATPQQDPGLNPTGWGQIKEDHGPIEYPANDHWGAWTIFAGLSGLPSGDAACTAGTVVDVARSELDKGVEETPDGSNKGGQIDLYTDGNPQAWCANFVSWVYKEAGTPFTDGVSTGGWRHPGVVPLTNWFKTTHTHFDKGGGEPQPGDVVFFHSEGLEDSWNGAHTGIVEGLEGGMLVTIEGNTANSVARRQYPNYMEDPYVLGFGRLGGNTNE